MTLLKKDTVGDEGNESPDQLERQALTMFEQVYDEAHSSLDNLDCNRLLLLASTLRQENILRAARHVALKAVAAVERQDSGNRWNALKELALIERLLKMFPEAEEHCRRAILLVEGSDRSVGNRLQALRNCLLDSLFGQGKSDEAQRLEKEWSI